MFEYDFAVDGGAVSAIPLRALVTPLTAGMFITDMYIHVETALASAGSPTATLGNTDVDGFFADIVALAGSDNAVIRVGEVAGALLWDDTNDHEIEFLVNSADDADFTVTIGTNALTAGKVIFIVEFYLPKAS